MTHAKPTKTIQQQAVALYCTHTEPSLHAAPTVGTGVPALAHTAASLSSRRTRLWELPTEMHCSVIGVCFSIDALRRLVVKHYKAPCIVGDYEVHAVVVQACGARTPLIELVQASWIGATKSRSNSFTPQNRRRPLQHFGVAPSRASMTMKAKPPAWPGRCGPA